jgi:hypothetical protein
VITARFLYCTTLSLSLGLFTVSMTTGCKTAPSVEKSDVARKDLPVLLCPKGDKAFSEEVNRVITLDSSIDSAKAILERSGFDCEWYVNEAGKKCLWADKSKMSGSIFVADVWRVIIEDQDGKVGSISPVFDRLGT